MSKARTSVMIDEKLLKQAKRAALEREISLSRLFEESLALGIQQSGRPRPMMGPLQELFDWADRAQLKSDDGPLSRDEAHGR